jgi:hypothetical protein
VLFVSRTELAIIISNVLSSLPYFRSAILILALSTTLRGSATD